MSIFHLPRAFHVNSAGVPYALAKLYVYSEGTLDLINLWTDRGFSIPLTNPVESDSNGIFPAIFLSGATDPFVRVQIKTASNALIYDQDEISIADNTFESASFAGSVTATGVVQSDVRLEAPLVTIQGSNPRIKLYQTDQITDAKLWDLNAEGSFLSIRTRTDADGEGSDLLRVLRGSDTEILSILIGNSDDAPSIYINSVNCTPRLSSFSGTLTGMSAGTTGTVNYFVIGSTAHIYMQSALTGTSNSTAMTLTGLPSALQPSGSRIVPCALVDNGVTSPAWASFTGASGTVTFGLSTISGAFTGSGTKGFPVGCVIAYPL